MAYPSQRARVLLWSATGRKEWSNVLHYEITGAFSSTFDISAAATSVNTFFSTLIRALLGTDGAWLGVDVSVENGGVAADASVDVNQAGTGSGLCLPNEVAAIVRLQTNVGGKSGRGRFFLSGLDSSLIADGRVISAGITLLDALGAQIRFTQTIQTQAWIPCVQSKKMLTYNPIQSTQSQPLVGTQRRRRPRR